MVFTKQVHKIGLSYKKLREQCSIEKIIECFYNIKQKDINDAVKSIYGEELVDILNKIDGLFKQIDKNGINASIYDEMMKYEVDISEPLLKNKNRLGIYTDRDRKCLIDITQRPIKELMVFPKLYYSVLEGEKDFYYLLFTIKDNNIIVLEFNKSSEAKISTTIESYRLGAEELYNPLIDKLPSQIYDLILKNLKEKAEQRWVKDFNIVYGE